MELRKACFFNLSVILHFDYFIVFDTFSTFIGGEFLFGKFERRRVPLPIHAIGKPFYILCLFILFYFSYNHVLFCLFIFCTVSYLLIAMFVFVWFFVCWFVLVCLFVVCCCVPVFLLCACSYVCCLFVCFWQPCLLFVCL